MGKKKDKKIELHECPTGEHLIWWTANTTARCPWCVITDNRRAFQRIVDICDE